jgi:vitamin K-dependent gamma-carboxylase
MVHQYAHCVKERLETINITDIAIFVDVWRSLNGRFHQRSIDPRVDILSADWSPFRPTAWLMPLLTELTPWREKMIDLEEKVFSESQSARVAFFADFPGLSMENWIPADVANASLYVLDGKVDVSFENGSRLALKTNETTILPTDGTHVVHTRSSKPACYMYTYMGLRADNETTTQNDVQDNDSVWLDLWSPYKKSIGLVSQSILSLVFGIPLVPLA